MRKSTSPSAAAAVDSAGNTEEPPWAFLSMKEKRGIEVIGASETAILTPGERFKHSFAKCVSLGIILPGLEAFASFLSLLSFCMCAQMRGWAGAQECMSEGCAGAQECAGAG